MRCYSHLSDDEREQIGLAKALGHSIGAIAKAIGRPKSTVSRELSRNKLPSGRYSARSAASLLALLPVIQPPQENPMTTDATAPTAIPCRRRVRDSPLRIEGSCMALAFR